MFRILRTLTFIMSVSVLAAHADTLTVTGTVLQNALDTSGGSTDNPSLNNVLDFKGYTVTVTLADGTFNGTGATFFDSANPSGNAEESNFQSVSVTETSSGGFDTFLVFACLNGFTCLPNTGHELDLSFKIASSDLFASSASATGLGLSPMELFEDSGATDIQGSINTYAFASGTNAVPEPSTIVLLVTGGIALLSRRHRNSS